jgi:hypothetical protein
MYILFALLMSALFYGLLVAILPRMLGYRPPYFTLLSSLFLAGGLLAFNLTSGLVGIDLGPARAVTYSIPGDYMAKGGAGLGVLTIYALTCASPVAAAVVSRTIQRGMSR